MRAGVVLFIEALFAAVYYLRQKYGASAQDEAKEASCRTQYHQEAEEDHPAIKAGSWGCVHCIGHQREPSSQSKESEDTQLTVPERELPTASRTS